MKINSNQIFKWTIILSVVVITGVIFYYYVYFLPNIKSEELHLQKNQQILQQEIQEYNKTQDRQAEFTRLTEMYRAECIELKKSNMDSYIESLEYCKGDQTCIDRTHNTLAEFVAADFVEVCTQSKLNNNW